MKSPWMSKLLLLTWTVFPLYAEEPAIRDARVTDASGPVTIKTADNPKQAVTVDEEAPLMEGDVVETGPQARAEITMDGETVFTLQAGTRLKIEKIFLRNTQLELSQGAVLAKIKPATRPDQNLILKMPTAVVAIRGTELGAETSEGLSHVCVFKEGHVVVAGAWGHEHVILGPYQETKVPRSNVPHPPYGLTHFQAYRNQIPHLRNRAAYWQKNWKPISPDQRQRVRQNLMGPNRKPSAGFRRPPEHKPPHKTVRPHRTTRPKHPARKSEGRNKRKKNSSVGR